MQKAAPALENSECFDNLLGEWDQRRKIRIASLFPYS